MKFRGGGAADREGGVEAVDLSPGRQDACPEMAWNPQLETYYRENFGRVVRWVRAHGVEAGEAEDVAQQVFLTVAKKREGGAVPSASGLFQTVRRVCANHRRGRRRSRTREARAPAPAAFPAPDEAAARADAAALFERFLRALPDDQRACFVLYEVDGMSAPEIAQALGIPPDRVYGRVRLARSKLARFVERQRAALRAGPGGGGAGGRSKREG